MSNVASSIAASLGVGHHSQNASGEFTMGVQTDATQTLYIVDGSQSGVGAELSDVGVGIEVDDSMLLAGESSTEETNFIVQDLHGNQFRKITGIDEDGKPVIFFQLSEDTEHETMTMTTVRLEESTAMHAASVDQVPTHFDFETSADDQPCFSVQNDHMYLDPQKW